MKIGIELHGVIRDINQQIVDYYRKDFDKQFDVEKVDLNTVNFLPQIPFESKQIEDKFMYIDYPYEVFGCAGTMDMHLPNTLNTWHRNLPKKDDILLLCSDGLTNMISVQDIFEEVKSGKSDLEKTCNNLISRSKKNGGYDNISVILVFND